MQCGWGWTHQALHRTAFEVMRRWLTAVNVHYWPPGWDINHCVEAAIGTHEGFAGSAQGKQTVVNLMRCRA